jgi:hypothetical protein
MEPTNKLIYYVNSYNRVVGTDSDFTYIFNIPPNIDVNRVVVLQASIPKTYYLIEDDNYFTLTENSNSVNISLPEGNYSVTQLKQTLSQLLTSNSPLGYTYTVDLSTTLGKFIFTVTNNTYQPIINVSNTLYELLGFNAYSTNTFISNSLTSTNVVNANRESTLFIHSDICQNASGDDILQEIYTVENVSNIYISWSNSCPQFYSKNFVNGKKIFRFYLCNENRTPIDLNGINMNLTILIYKFS